MTETRWGMEVDPERPHLGGYIAGGDPATFYPELWTWLVQDWGVRSVMDVGAGDGRTASYFVELGVETWGIEGIEQEQACLIAHDYAEGPWPSQAAQTADRVDLVWSAEFVEHVEERYVPNFLATFALGRYVLMTHGEPGQPGHHHVNNQPAEYWKGALAGIGYEFDEQLTWQARRLANLNESPHNHFRRSGLAFRRYE